ncbi:ZPBP2 protein, partial [Urocolius indicus]|nr:ZPBP2 protein [Urocolius indicus]
SRAAVKVYVKVFTNSPFLVCMDVSYAKEEVIDPKYLWTGPDGKDLEGQKYVNLTETGKLMVREFKESMSGAYTCTLSHKVIQAMTHEEREMVEAYKFMVYAYQEADHAYQVFVRYVTNKCQKEVNDGFFEELIKSLNSIVSDLKCHITEPFYKCHSIRTPEQGLLHELFISFQVNPFASRWEGICHQIPYYCEDSTNRRVEEARVRTAKFFEKQAYLLKHELQTVPAIYYLENSIAMTRINHCRPGFGKNITHKKCAACCVVCEPGTYSPNNDVTCQICARPQVKTYGATSC